MTAKITHEHAAGADETSDPVGFYQAWRSWIHLRIGEPAMLDGRAVNTISIKFGRFCRVTVPATGEATGMRAVIARKGSRGHEG